MNYRKQNKGLYQKIFQFISLLISNLIKNLLAAIGLASLFKEKINWAPIIDNAIDIYRTTIYPVWHFLLGWIGYDLPNYINDILTINVLLLIAISSSGVVGNKENISLFRMIWDEIITILSKFIKGLKNKSEKKIKQMARAFLDALAQMMFNLFMASSFISLAWLIYIGLVINFLKNILSTDNSQLKIESRNKFINLIRATILTFHGFIALIGLNYAIGLINHA